MPKKRPPVDTTPVITDDPIADEKPQQAEPETAENTDEAPKHVQEQNGGRKCLPFDTNLFEGLCRIQCTESELASVLMMDISTVRRAVKRIYKSDFATIYKKYSEQGKSSLRRTQLRIAEHGNASMAIWLGKQMLGQSDNPQADTKDAELMQALMEAVLK